MPSFNKAIIMGHLGKTPELQSASNGEPYCFFSIATKRWGKEDITDWHDCVVFGNPADWIAHTPKGALILVEGVIQYRKKEGYNKDTTIKVLNLNILTKERLPNSPIEEEVSEIEPEDDLPF